MTSNPFIDAHRACAHERLATFWARLAVMAQEIADDERVKARAMQDRAERGFRKLAKQTRGRREAAA
jgi:hypothetical protein